MKKQFLFLLLLIPFMVSSCQDDESSNLDRYKGTWKATITITTLVDGKKTDTTESKSDVEITTGENTLYINGSMYKVLNNTISTPKATIKNSSNGMTIEVTTEATGTLLDNKILIQQSAISKITYPDKTVENSTQTVTAVLTR